MKNSNYSILQQNVLLGLETEKGQAAFLWACDRPGMDKYSYKAEKFAHEVENIIGFLTPIIGFSIKQFPNMPIKENLREDIVYFIEGRHCAYRFGGKKRWQK